MTRKKVTQSSRNDELSTLGPISPEAINEELRIIRYVEKETAVEKVLVLNKGKTEQVFDTRMDIWKVDTDKNQYWVITNPAGLYSQVQLPSFDYALSFHVGLSYRMASNQRLDSAGQEQNQLAVP